MSRVIFQPGKQKEFFKNVMKKINCNSDDLGQILHLSGRTIRDWIREKYFPTAFAIEKLSRISKVPIPPMIESRSEYWSAIKYAQKGGFAKQLKCGSTLTLKDKVKGGKNSWIRRRQRPDFYKSLKCVVPNQFTYPPITNVDFAEFIGIVLGDGGFSSSQLSITLNRVTDQKYIEYVYKLIQKLFSYTPKIIERRHACATVLMINGVDLIRYLQECGLVIGNKTKLQVGVPKWISNDIILSKQCVRGLMDTDGCLFKNKYKVNGKWYEYIKTAFANKSQPLLKFVYRTLFQVGLHPIYYQQKQIRLCSQKETMKYLEIIGSSNSRLTDFIS